MNVTITITEAANGGHNITVIDHDSNGTTTTQHVVPDTSPLDALHFGILS